jgi:hypothetical protein
VVGGSRNGGRSIALESARRATVEPGLLDLRVQRSVGAVPPEGALVIDGQPPASVVDVVVVANAQRHQVRHRRRSAVLAEDDVVLMAS